ncbi:helix-turn-helix domain-containing protein [Paracoccus luteus]|uniref:helix-turn-helix domain-containing protein n=1 Tax=Paracoccus luteus TaxID=2508543 RepID=UPI00106F26D1|nr:helix-turn-helix domain-containing protein [Paracoccus luteus]
MNARPSKLDTDKLRKLHALMTRGATEGERAAAKAKAEGLARAAGLTLDAALSILDASTQPSAGNPFAGFADWMEAREPGWKTEQARRNAEREAKRLARYQALLGEYGSEKALFAATRPEQLLRKALAPLRAKRNGLDGFKDWLAGNPTEAMWQAMRGAVPFPDTLAGIWDELRGWEKLMDDRYCFEPYYETPPHIWARQAALEHLMDRMPAPSFDGLRLRLDWVAHLNAREVIRDNLDDQALVAAMRADLEALAAVQSGRHSRSSARTQVLALLHGVQRLSDREIARRVGCSPQTVGNIRRAAA